MKRFNVRAAILVASAILASYVFISCASAPVTEPERIPPALSQEELERMELDAIYRLIEGDKLEEATGRIAALRERNPLNRDYPLLQASLLLSLGRLGEARDIAKAEAEGEAGNLNALYILSEIERFAGDGAAQKKALDALLAKDPNHADGQAAMGDIQYAAKNYRAAETSYQKALAAEPAHVEALLGLARVLYRREDRKGALAVLDKAREAAPSDPIVRLDRSRVLYQLGRYAECEDELNEAIRLAPGSAWSYVERGVLLMDTGRYTQAESDFSRAIELDPDYFLSYVYRAGLREESGDDEGALEDYRVITRLNPQYWFSFESIGVLSYRLGLWQDAYAAFDKAAAATPNHPEYYIAAGLSLMRSGQARAAKDYAGKMLPKIDRERYPAHWLALRLIYDQTDMSAELEVKIQAEKSLDAKAGLLYYLGAYWVGRGRTELGLKYIRMSWDQERIGTVERRLAEADLKRLPSIQN